LTHVKLLRYWNLYAPGIMRRQIRRFALLTLLGLLFSQVALAAYACRWADAAANWHVVGTGMPADCDGMAGTGAGAMSTLCAQHCKAEAGFDTATVAAQVGAVVPSLPFTLRLPFAEAASVRPPPDPDLAAAGRPLLLALHARLRI
jgi:hypothetical protein